MTKFLLMHWQFVVIGVLLVSISASGYYITLLKAQKGTLISDKKTLVAELGVSQASVKSLTAAVEDQNKAVEKLKTDAADRLTKATAEIARARANAESANRTAEELLKKQVPQGVTQCDAANDLFNEEIGRAKK